MDSPPEGEEVSMGETFNRNKLFAMSSDSALFVPGEAPNARVGCTSSSGINGRGRFGTRTPNVECSPACCVSRLGDPLPVSLPDDPGASTPVPRMFLPPPNPVLRSSTPLSHDIPALSDLSSIVDGCDKGRATPRALTTR